MARFFSVAGRDAAALKSLDAALAKLPAANRTAYMTIASRRGEMTAKLLLEEQARNIAKRAQ